MTVVGIPWAKSHAAASGIFPGVPSKASTSSGATADAAMRGASILPLKWPALRGASPAAPRRCAARVKGCPDIASGAKGAGARQVSVPGSPQVLSSAW